MSAVERMAGRLEGHADVMRCVAKDREDAWAKINGTDLHAWAYTMQQAATQLRALLAEHEALLARVEADRLDAERYRWLRCGGWEVMQDPKYWRPELGFDGAIDAGRTAVCIDAAIDAARQGA